MSAVDITIVVLIAGAVLIGYHRGFISQLLSVAGLFIAYIAAYQFYDDVSPWIKETVPMAAFEPIGKYEEIVGSLKLDHFLYNALAFSVIFFGVKIGLTVVGYFLNTVAKFPGINAVNKWSGALLSLAEIVVIIIIAINILQILPSDTAKALAADSRATELMDTYLPAIAAKLQDLWSK